MNQVVLVRGSAGFRHVRQPPKTALDQTRFVALEWEAQELFRGAGLPFLSPKDYVGEAKAREADAFVQALSREWRLGLDGKDFTEFHGVSLGKLYDVYFCDLQFQPAYRSQVFAEAIIARENPRVVLCEGTSSGFLLEALQRVREKSRDPFELKVLGNPPSRAWEVREVMGPAYAWSLDQSSRRSRWAENLTKILFDGSAFFFQRVRSPSPNRRRLLVSYHVAMKDLYRALMRSPWSRAFDVVMLEPPSRDLLFASWARGFRLLRGERLGGVPPVPNSLTGEDESRLLEIASTYEGLAQSVKYQERFIFSGLSPWSRLDHVMRDSFIQSLTQIARWVAFLDHFMDSQAMDAVLVPIDCMPRQAAVVEVAKKKKLPNIVLLHGLPGHHSGNYFMNADTLALGGEEIKNQFVAQGRDPGSIVTNCVCYLDPSVRSSGLPPPPKDGRNRVLLLTSTLFFQSCLSSPEDPEVYLNTVLDVLAGFPGLSITVRPHPSESPAYYRSLLAGRSGVRLEAQQDIEPLLDEHDIVIGPATTVLAQAAVLGKAVLCVNFTRCEYPPPFAPHGGFPFASSAVELQRFLREVAAPRPAAGVDYSEVLTRFVGTLDGQSCDRLLSFVSDACAAKNPRGS